MYTKGNQTFADAGNQLALEGNGYAFQAESLTVTDEIPVTLEDMDIRYSGSTRIAVCTAERVSFVAHDTFAENKKSVVGMRYSNDDQLAIMLNRDGSEEREQDYERMQAWRDFAAAVAAKIDSLI